MDKTIGGDRMNALTPAAATVLAALLSAAAAIVVGLVNSRSQRQKFTEEMKNRDIEREKAEAVRDAELKMWMKQVDQKLDTHNGYAEKFADIGKSIAAIEANIKNLYRKGD